MENDLISREALKEEIKNTVPYVEQERILDIIDDAPTVKPCDNCDLYFIAKTKEEMRKGKG